MLGCGQREQAGGPGRVSIRPCGCAAGGRRRGGHSAGSLSCQRARTHALVHPRSRGLLYWVPGHPSEACRTPSRSGSPGEGARRCPSLEPCVRVAQSPPARPGSDRGLGADRWVLHCHRCVFGGLEAQFDLGEPPPPLLARPRETAGVKRSAQRTPQECLSVPSSVLRPPRPCH